MLNDQLRGKNMLELLSSYTIVKASQTNFNGTVGVFIASRKGMDTFAEYKYYAVKTIDD